MEKKTPLSIEEMNHMTDMLIACRDAMETQEAVMKTAAAQQSEIFKSLKNDFHTKREALQEAMTSNGMTQMRRDTTTVSISNRIGLQVNDPKKFIHWLKRNKYGHVIKTVPATETIDGLLMRGLSNTLAAADKLPTGTERVEKAVMSVRDKKQTEDAAAKLKKK